MASTQKLISECPRTFDIAVPGMCCHRPGKYFPIPATMRAPTIHVESVCSLLYIQTWFERFAKL